MLKKIFLYLSSTAIILPISQVISCGGAPVEYYVMKWEIDLEKVENLKKDYSSFNSEPISVEKLKKVIKGDGSYIDPYTKKAIEENWFSKIEFNGTPGNLVLELKKEKEVNKKTIKCPYRFKNNSLTLKI